MAPRRSTTLTLAAVALACMTWSAPPAQAASVRFAHPQADDHIEARRSIQVRAVAFGADLPEDVILEVSENNGASFTSLGGNATGRSIGGSYVPSAHQGSVVVFRTRSVTDGFFNQQIHAFVDR